MPWIWILLLSGCATLGPGARTSVEEIVRKQTWPRETQSAPRFLNPVAGKTWVLSPFGKREERPHQGVDLRAPQGTPIQAAAPGTVVYAGSGIDGYGATLVLKHQGGYFSLYAHLSEMLVGEGQDVVPGKSIAKSGDSGRASGPHLHFEIRRSIEPLDPVPLIFPRSPKSPTRILVPSRAAAPQH